MPDSLWRKPIEPWGMTVSPVAASMSAGFHSAASTSCPRSAAFTKRSGTHESPWARSDTRKGRSVNRLE